MFYKLCTIIIKSLMTRKVSINYMYTNILRLETYDAFLAYIEEIPVGNKEYM